MPLNNFHAFDMMLLLKNFLITRNLCEATKKATDPEHKVVKCYKVNNHGSESVFEVRRQKRHQDGSVEWPFVENKNWALTSHIDFFCTLNNKRKKSKSDANLAVISIRRGFHFLGSIAAETASPAIGVWCEQRSAGCKIVSSFIQNKSAGLLAK